MSNWRQIFGDNGTGEIHGGDEDEEIGGETCDGAATKGEIDGDGMVQGDSASSQLASV
jgi:hypothetical protein